MTEAERLTALRRELHAAIVIQALIPIMRTDSRGEPLPVEAIVDRAFEFADALIAKGGPLE